jgi:hypothetical protein
MRKMTAQMPIDILLSNHAGWDGTLEKMSALRARAPGAPHPFVTGPQVDPGLHLMGECARANRVASGWLVRYFALVPARPSWLAEVAWQGVARDGAAPA